MKTSQRLYVTQTLNESVPVELDAGQAHYLAHVLRLTSGSEVLLFNGRDGEWVARLQSVNKKGGLVVCTRQSRPQDVVPNLWLLFAPIKGDRTDYIVEKATELGAAGIIPVITERTIVRKVNLDKLRARCIEAAEQCERLSIPEVMDAMPLSSFYNTPPDEKIGRASCRERVLMPV